MTVSDCGPGYKGSRTTYRLEVERERDGVRLWTRMQIKWNKTTYKLHVERVRDCVRL